MPKRAKLPKYVDRSVAKGRVYYYVRVAGTRLGRLPDDPNSAEFHEAYARILRSVEADASSPRSAEGTVGWLVAEYKAASSAFKSRELQTQVSYARELDRLCSLGPFQATVVKRKHISAIRETLIKRPRTQNMFSQVGSILFNFGTRECNLEMSNPARLMKQEIASTSYKAWTEEEMEAFEQSNPPVRIMTGYMIARYSGRIRGDAVALTIKSCDGKSITVAGSKKR